MKKALLLLLIAALFFAGCQKGLQPVAVATTGGIIGKWQQQSEVAVLYVAGKEVYRKPFAVGSNDFMEFRSTGVVANYAYVSAGSYSETDGTYTLASNGTDLSMVVQGYTQAYQCNFVNSNTITLSGSAASATGVTSYTLNGVTYKADSATLLITMVRI